MEFQIGPQLTLHPTPLSDVNLVLKRDEHRLLDHSLLFNSILDHVVLLLETM